MYGISIKWAEILLNIPDYYATESLWNIQNYYKKHRTILKCTELLWKTSNYYEAHRIIMKHTKLLSNTLICLLRNTANYYVYRQGPPNLRQSTFWPGSRIKTKKIENLLQQHSQITCKSIHLSFIQYGLLYF